MIPRGVPKSSLTTKVRSCKRGEHGGPSRGDRYRSCLTWSHAAARSRSRFFAGGRTLSGLNRGGHVTLPHGHDPVGRRGASQRCATFNGADQSNVDSVADPRRGRLALQPVEPDGLSRIFEDHTRTAQSSRSRRRAGTGSGWRAIGDGWRRASWAGRGPRSGEGPGACRKAPPRWHCNAKPRRHAPRDASPVRCGVPPATHRARIRAGGYPRHARAILYAGAAAADPVVSTCDSIRSALARRQHNGAGPDAPGVGSVLRSTVRMP